MHVNMIDSIVACILYLENPKNSTRFIKSEKNTLDVRAICECPKIQQRMAVAHTFLALFGCPPSRKILLECLDDPVQEIITRWPFLNPDNVRRVYQGVDRSNVRKLIAELIAHYNPHNVTNLVGSFIKVFGNIQKWSKIDKQIDDHFADLYHLTCCIGNVCIVINNLDNFESFIETVADATPRRIHVFSETQVSHNHVWHRANTVSTFPINLFKHIVRIDDCDIRINSALPMRLSRRLDEAAHIVKTALKTSPPDMSRYTAFWDTIGELWDRMRPVHFDDSNSENAVIAFETRINPLTVMACKLSCSNLDPHKWRGVVMFCSKQHIDYYTKELEDIAYAVIGLDALTVSKFTLDDYNDLLKSHVIWELLWNRGIKRVLLVQDDGFIVRPGVERFFEWDYVGAPWREGQDVLRSMTNPDLVGNGGLSLRGVSAMLTITRRHIKKDIWTGSLSQTPEDTHFARYVYEDGHRLCPRVNALQFSSEQVYSHGCCGVHKPWPYLTSNEIRNLLH